MQHVHIPRRIGKHAVQVTVRTRARPRIYTRMGSVALSTAWRRLVDVIETYYMSDWSQRLNVPATDEAIDEASAATGLAYPADLRALYKLHNGGDPAMYRYARQGQQLADNDPPDAVVVDMDQVCDWTACMQHSESNQHVATICSSTAVPVYPHLSWLQSADIIFS